MAIFEEDSFVNDNHPPHYNGEIDLFISSRGNNMTVSDASTKNIVNIEKRPFFARSHSLSFRDRQSKSRKTLSRQGSKRSSRQSLRQHRQPHSFSHSRRASKDKRDTTLDSAKLMSCFDTPPPRTMLGNKNTENWSSFHNRYAESNKRQRKPKKSKEERDEIKMSRQKRKKKKKNCLLSVLSCFRRKHTTYHGDDENCEFHDERGWSFGKKYARKLAETERTQLYLME